MPPLDLSDSSPLRPRVFGIGLNKTGTTSLFEALEVLGLRCLHGGRADGTVLRGHVLRAKEAGEPLLTDFDPGYDAFMDIGALSTRFHLLDAQYPGSRFVLTVRPVDAWIDSRRRHVERNQQAKARGDYDGTFLEVEPDQWRAAWERHMERTHAHFAGRSDFLEVDLTDDPGWGPLCALLDVPVPDEAFPWANRDSRRSGRWARP